MSGGLAKKEAVNIEQINIMAPDTDSGSKAEESMEDALDKALGGEEEEEQEQEKGKPPAK